MAAARHAAHLDGGVGFPGGEGLQARREGMELQSRGKTRSEAPFRVNIIKNFKIN